MTLDWLTTTLHETEIMRRLLTAGVTGISCLRLLASVFLAFSYIAFKGVGDLRPLVGLTFFVALSALTLIVLTAPHRAAVDRRIAPYRSDSTDVARPFDGRTHSRGIAFRGICSCDGRCRHSSRRVDPHALSPEAIEAFLLGCWMEELGL